MQLFNLRGYGFRPWTQGYLPIMTPAFEATANRVSAGMCFPLPFETQTFLFPVPPSQAFYTHSC